MEVTAIFAKYEDVDNKNYDSSSSSNNWTIKQKR